MKTKNKILVFLFVGLAATTFSQNLKDAIKLTTNEQFDKAAEVFNNLVNSQPNNGEVLFYQGENYFKNEQFDKSLESFKKGANVNPTNPICYVGIGKLLWYQGKQAKVIAL